MQIINSQQIVDASTLLQYVPGTSNFVIDGTVAAMAWAKAQGHAGAFPTLLAGSSPVQWQLVVIGKSDHVVEVSAKSADVLSHGSATTDPAINWGRCANRYIRKLGQGYTCAIPMDDMSGTDTTLLAFKGGSALQSGNPANWDLTVASGQAQQNLDLSDSGLWLMAGNQWAQQQGALGAWPTWEETTQRGMNSVFATEPGALPGMTDEAVDNVKALLENASQALVLAGSIAGDLTNAFYEPLSEDTIEDPKAVLAQQIMLGAFKTALGAVPEVGGVLSGIFEIGTDALQTALEGAGIGDGALSVASYVQALWASVVTLKTEVDQLYDSLNNDPSSVWSSTYTSPFNGMTVQVGQLANLDSSWFDKAPWNEVAQNIANAWVEQFIQSYAQQRFVQVYRSYDNSGTVNQRWLSTTLTEFNQKGGAAAQFIAKTESNYSVWFPGAWQDGSRVKANEIWMAAMPAAMSSGSSSFPAGETVQAIFGNDGYGTSAAGGSLGYASSWIGFFDKSQAYTRWLTPWQSVTGGTFDGYMVLDYWVYNTGGYLSAHYRVDYETDPNTGSQYVSGTTLLSSVSSHGAASGGDTASIQVVWRLF